MASFAPLNAYFVALLDELIARHGVTGPFLDLGCGSGYVAAHLARRGWTGRAVDDSPVARAAAQRALAGCTQVTVTETLPPPTARFGLVLLFDVLEHVADDAALLASAAARQPPGASVVLTVPTNAAREWRWDDDFYGHVRRYDLPALSATLRQAGYRPVTTWDVSFPVFWAARRIITALTSPPEITGSAAERTAATSNVESAYAGGAAVRALARFVPWRALFALQRPFRSRLEWGNEVMVLARRDGPCTAGPIR